MKHALIALAAVIVVGCTKNVHLQDYSPTDAGFTASLPAAPREESRDLKTALGTLTEHSFVADYDEVTWSLMESHGDFGQLIPRVGLLTLLAFYIFSSRVRSRLA